MLPSTGYFKGINCPFYDSGLCERPYCHFRHVKRECLNANNDGIESGAILQKLVSAAVQKVLQQADTSINTTQLATTVSSAETNAGGDALQTSKVTYNPTPISELNKIVSADTESNEDSSEIRKRHIPVPYTPRKPAGLPIKRPVDSNGSSKPFIYIPPPVKYLPGSTETTKIDPYTPKGTVESKDKYLPGTQTELQEYTPKESVQQSSNKHNYIPSDKSHSKRKILEYKPIKVNAKSAIPSVTYQPTPRSQVPCFSSDEEEPDSKKTKLSNDLNGLDDLGPEFDILDQILDEEKPEDRAINENNAKDVDKIKDNVDKGKDRKEIKLQNEYSTKDKNKSKNPEKRSHNTINSNKKEDTSSHENRNENSSSHQNRKENSSSHENRNENTSSHQNKKEKTSSNQYKKENTSSHEKKKSENKTKSSEKSSLTSSSKDHKSKDHKSKSDKKKEDRKDKHSSEKKQHSSSKNSDSSSKKDSSKDSDRHSKHSSSSKLKTKDKNHHHKTHKSSKDSKDRHKKKKADKINYSSDNDIHNDENPGLEADDILLSESDEETRALECKKIFEEYIPTEKCKINDEIEDTIDENHDEYVPSKKRISRTSDKNIKIIPKAPIKPDYKVGAAQAMAERLQKVREYHASKQPIPINSDSIMPKVESTKGTFNAGNVSNSKIRIAHVPYVSTMLSAKKTIQPHINIVKSEPSTSSTVVQTIKKGAQRTAHVPNDKFIDRPGVLEPLASKIPANIRSTYLNMMIDECLKIYLSATDAYARAQHEELTTSKKCSTVQIYKNSAVLAVSRLRKEFQECNGVKKSGSDCTTLQKIPQTIAGKTSNAGSWSIENKNKKSFDNTREFSGAKLYNNIKKWILSEELLQANGFPRPHPNGEKGKAMIYSQNKQKPPKGYIRTCCRCKKDYTVDKKGFPAVTEECIYHPNNKYRVRGESRYQCCSQDSTSDGCCIAPSHVYEYVDYENLRGYVRTLPPESTMEDYGVYSLDCEMCYTTHGLDLTRVTVINSSCKVVYETLVRPLHPIIDYNTRYSGITEEQMLQVRTTLLEVQATLLAMFNNKTILIGHSLESDFKALKLMHDTVIDTSVLFPHKMGPPYKRALRNLSSEHLKKIIQNSVDGHDSAEDATVCMELMHYKLKEDLKTR